VFNGTGAFDGVEAQYEALVSEASTLGLMYVHLLDHSAMGAPAVPAALKAKLRSLFKGTFRACVSCLAMTASYLFSILPERSQAAPQPSLAVPKFSLSRLYFSEN